MRTQTWRRSNIMARLYHSANTFVKSFLNVCPDFGDRHQPAWPVSFSNRLAVSVHRRDVWKYICEALFESAGGEKHRRDRPRHVRACSADSTEIFERMKMANCFGRVYQLLGMRSGVIIRRALAATSFRTSLAHANDREHDLFFLRESHRRTLAKRTVAKRTI